MLNIQLTVEEINVIIAALSKQPYEDVALLIANVREQAIKQLNPQPAAEPADQECCE